MNDEMYLEEARIKKEARRTVKDHWRLFLLQGVVLVLAGLAAIVVPQIASIAAAIFIGWLLIISGAVRLVALYGARRAAGFWGQLIVAALMVVLGALLLVRPIAAAVTLTLVLTIYFIAHGIASFVFAYAIRADTDRWPWLLLSGLVDLALAGIIIAGWPGTATWVLGLLAGVDLLITGVVLVYAALGARRAEA